MVFHKSVFVVINLASSSLNAIQHVSAHFIHIHELRAALICTFSEFKLIQIYET